MVDGLTSHELKSEAWVGTAIPPGRFDTDGPADRQLSRCAQEIQLNAARSSGQTRTGARRASRGLPRNHLELAVTLAVQFRSRPRQTVGNGDSWSSVEGGGN